VAMVFVDTPVDTAIKRNKERGRHVQEEFLIKAYKDSQKLKKFYSSEFRKFTEILNGEGELIDKVIIDAYRKMENFFLSPIENPIGKELKEEMIENGYKYLDDTPEYDIKYIKKLASN
jgi:thymidylate kinase